MSLYFVLYSFFKPRPDHSGRGLIYDLFKDFAYFVNEAKERREKMLISVPYNRIEAVNYADRWAYRRNPEYYDFNDLGGDCTNFASQCLFAGSGVMNYPSWYYYGLNDRSPSWTGVEFLYDFLIKNRGVGPRGEEAGIENVRKGDIVQLSFSGERFEHTPVIVSVGTAGSPSEILLAAHTFDSNCRPLDSYAFKKVRFIHIKDVGKDV